MKMMLADCRVKATIDVIRGKWKAIIIKALKDRNLGYGELRRLVPEPSKKVLTIIFENWKRTALSLVLHQAKEFPAANTQSQTMVALSFPC
jgi:hypothetical protein